MEENKRIIGPARAVTGKPAKPVVERSRKRRLRGKGGPENEGCTFVGVRQRTWGKWVAEIREPNRGTRLWLGTFNTATDAAMAYDEAKRRLYGPCAKLNLSQPRGHQQCHSDNTSVNNSSVDTVINTGIDVPIAGDIVESESSKMDLDGLMINHNDIMQGFGNWSKQYDDGFVGTSCENNNNDSNNHNFGVLFSGNEDEFMDYSTFGLQTPSSF